jgi:hypothetical protein
VLAGKSEVQRSITNVLDHVLEKYKYTSLNELNAVLKLYNVKADNGVEGGRIHSFKGLNYVVVDSEGRALTKPIKASSFHNKPTLAFIEKKGEANIKLREPHQQKLKTAIEWSFRSKPGSLAELAKHLKREKVTMVIRSSEQGQVYGLTYIDHFNRTVFNGSDLGKEYSAKKILERLSDIQQLKQEKDLQRNIPQHETKPKEYAISNEELPVNAVVKIIDQVVEPDTGESNAINKEMLTNESRKKKKGFNKQWEM